MITDLRIHGDLGAETEFYATIRGEGIGHPYFHEAREKDGEDTHRFFFGGHEFSLDSEGITHRGNGGSFCPYMVGVEEPIEDLIKPDVINRLVLFGAREQEGETDKARSLHFTRETGGHETWKEVFLRGHAVFNYFFFIQIPGERDLVRQQERILRLLGRSLKRFPLSLEIDDSAISEMLHKLWDRGDGVIFLLRLVNRHHLEYYRTFDNLYSQSRFLREEDHAILRDLASRLSIDFYSQERMKMDVLARHPDNYQVVAEYQSVLVDIWKRKRMDFEDRARITRLRTVALRRDIPLSLLDALDEKLLLERESLQGKEPEYLVEARAVLETFFLKRRKVGVHLETEDLIRILRAKAAALEHRDAAFDSMLIEVGKRCDELGSSTGDSSILEDFGSVVTYFDRFDAVYHDINRVAFHEGQDLSEDRLRSLLRNKRVFDGISEGLFRDLFVRPIFKNPYLTQYGRGKLETLVDGLSCVETGDLSVQEVIRSLAAMVTEERDFHMAKTIIGNWMKKTGRELRTEEEEQFLGRAREQMLARGLVAPATGAEVFSHALADLRNEKIYFSAVLPQLVGTGDAAKRREFLSSTGIETLRAEEIEKEFARAYQVDEAVMQKIRGSVGTPLASAAVAE
jgi:uncharacterized protein (TIGR04442 family)